MTIERPIYTDALLRSVGNGLIKIVTGMRRSGKSFLLKRLFLEQLRQTGVAEDHIIVVDMESRHNLPLKDPDALLRHIEGAMAGGDAPYFIMIDEVQEVDDFVSVLSTLAVTDGADVYVTGSNSRFLSADVATQFRGRADELHVWPLSFGEFAGAFAGNAEEALEEYLTHGGLPQLLTQQGDDRKEAFLGSLYTTVYLRDIYERNNIQLKAEFEQMAQVIASSVGAPVNPLSIAHTFLSESKSGRVITDKTVVTYLDYMRNAFLVARADRYDIKGRRYIGSLSKWYFEDVGLRNALLSFRQKDYGHLMENVLHNEMRIRGWKVDVGTINHRSRNSQGQNLRMQIEVDFVCNKGSNRLYIQSAWRIGDEEKMEQEKRPLRNVSDAFGKVLVLGERTKAWRDDYGILTISIFDFLLGTDSPAGNAIT